MKNTWKIKFKSSLMNQKGLEGDTNWNGSREEWGGSVEDMVLSSSIDVSIETMKNEQESRLAGLRTFFTRFANERDRS